MKIIYEAPYKINEQQPCAINYVDSYNYAGMSHMHYHPYYEVYFLVSGKRKYFFRNKIYTLEQGDIIIIKPNEPHRAIPLKESNQRYERYILNIDESLFGKIEKYNKDIKKIFHKGIFSLDSERFIDLLSILKNIETEIKEKKSGYKNSVRNRIERIFINLSMCDDNNFNEGDVSKNDLRIQEAIEYIVANYNKRITLKECADICYMGESNFTKVFHDIVGINFKSYVNSVRIEKACEMLINSNLSISEISETVGFENCSYFANVFKKNLGILPKDFRTAKSNH